MKSCKKCGVEKPPEGFYKHPLTKDGRDNTCKDCRKEKVRQSRRKRIDHYRDYDRKRGNRAKPGYVKSWRQRSRIKEQAHNRVSRAVASGRLVKPDACEQCETDSHELHAHHDDYAKQLEVRWLCAPCHQQWHSEHGEAKNANMDPLPRNRASEL